MKPIIDLDVLESYRPQQLRVLDTSLWKHLEGQETFIDITLPSRTNVITKEFVQNSITVFNAFNLGLVAESDTDTPLPDGFYKLRLYVCDSDDRFSKTITVLRAVKLLNRLDSLLIEMDLCCNLPKKAAIQKYMEIYLLLKSAHANTRQGNIEQAKCEWDKAKELMNDYEHCLKDKNCGKDVWM